MPQTVSGVSSFWLLLRRLLFSRKEVLALPLERTYSLQVNKVIMMMRRSLERIQNYDIAEDIRDDIEVVEADVYIDPTLFW